MNVYKRQYTICEIPLVFLKMPLVKSILDNGKIDFLFLLYIKKYFLLIYLVNLIYLCKFCKELLFSIFYFTFYYLKIQGFLQIR